jgi:UDP-glucose:(heptosyl)LPS alpha-1,3-glucosyltransferase
LRLAVVSPFVDRRHGTERALAELLERLARNYHCEIHLYAQRVDDLPLSPPGAANSQDSGAILWHKVPSIPGPHLLQFLCWMFFNSIRRAWDRRISGLHFDFVLSPGINCLDANVVIVHALFHRLLELSRDESLQSSSLGLFRRFHRRAYYSLLARLERRLYSNPAVTLAAVSQRTASLLDRYFHRQDVAVIPNGVDAVQFSPSLRFALRADARHRRNLQEQDFVLLLIGNDWRAKGLESVLRSVSALRSLPLQILIVGNESPEPFFQLATQLGILDRCRFELPRHDVLDFYAAADLYVSPSLEDSFGLPAAEAMACGLPAITSHQAGVAELIQDRTDGFVLNNPQDSQELARLVHELFRDPDRRRRAGEAAARKAVQWTWDRHAAAVFDLLQSL